MSELYHNKYRIESARLKNWNYGWNAPYFITICTLDRKCFFGDVADGKMRLSPLGVIADICWYEIKNHTKNVDLGEFVIMPNHVHGILILNGDDDRDVPPFDAVEALHATPLPPPSDHPKNEQMANISPKSNTVSTIIRSYKSAVTKHAHRLGLDFEWQSRFYDHIIRDEKSYCTISKYIINNPMNWSADKFCET